MTDQSPSRRDREKERRRKEILDAALRVFAESGYEATTLDEIAAAAEYGKGTLYNYFSSKEELFATMIEEGVAEFHRYVAERLHPVKSAAEQRLDVFIDASLEFYQQNQNFLRVYMLQMMQTGALQTPLRDKLKSIWKKKLNVPAGIFRAGIKEGVFRDGDPVQLATALKWMINSQYFQLLTTRNADAKQAADFIKELWRYGILRRNKK